MEEKKKAAIRRWRQSILHFFIREKPKDIWELNDQIRRMETKATVTLAIAIATLILSITIGLVPQLIWR